jgi:mRNA-degrading endonuclease RelE of RelBE toxin-antitoxin system
MRESPVATEYELFSTMTFDGQLDGLQERDRERIRRKVLDLARYPYRNTLLLRPPHEGKRRFRVGDYRVLFTICGECRQSGFQLAVKCEGCPGRADKTVTLREVAHRSRVYDG